MPLTLSPNPRMFGNHKVCGLGHSTFLIGHVTSRDHVKKMSNDLMDKSPSHLVTTVPSLLVIGLVEEEIQRV